MFGNKSSLFGDNTSGLNSLTKQREEFLLNKARDERQELLARSQQRLEGLMSGSGQILMNATQEMVQEPDDIVHMLNNMDVELEDDEVHPSKPKKAKMGETTYQIQEYLQSGSRLEVDETLDDLHTEWLIAVKPSGNRVLAIVGNGITELAFKNGRCRRMQSNLLGGNQNNVVQGVTQLLDCVLGASDRLYIIDAIMVDKKWLHDHPFEVRQFFIRSKVEESADLSGVNNKDLVKLHILNYLTASQENISTVMLDLPESERDGLLLVEKSAPYVLGEQNPDCIWLRPDVNPDDEHSTLGSLTLRFNLFEKSFQTKDKGFSVRCPAERIAHGEQNFGDSCFWKGSHGGSLKLIDGKHYQIGIRKISEEPSLFCRDIPLFTVFGYTNYDAMSTGTVKGKLDMILSTVTAGQFVQKHSKSRLMEE